MNLEITARVDTVLPENEARALLSQGELELSVRSSRIDARVEEPQRYASVIDRDIFVELLIQEVSDNGRADFFLASSQRVPLQSSRVKSVRLIREDDTG